MAKRGFFAELQHQSRLADQKRQRQAAAQTRQLASAHRAAEQARRATEREQAAALRMSVAELKQGQANAKRLHDESMAAQAALQSLEVAAQHAEIASILRVTLDVDDFVDLESLRVTVQHPPFSRTDLEVPTPEPPEIAIPLAPQYVEPERPSGLSRMFGGTKKLEELTNAARETHAQAMRDWEYQVAQVPAWVAKQKHEWGAKERERLRILGLARDRYDRECQQRESAAQQDNTKLDRLIAGLATNDEEAIQEYVGIVLGNSVYPESFPVDHDFNFDVESRELTLIVSVPPPDRIPSLKEVRYNRTRDELVPVMLTKRELQSRYTSALALTALRTLHEVFEADREGRIRTVALTIDTNTIDPATGHETVIPLLAVAADRTEFTAYELAQVEPLATLSIMKAAISKNPLALTPVNVARDVRG